ncbi:MAG: hypothetical protein LBC85_04480 [Fibromonadaceae bacterium]|jgi:hypothetical protein|nr:hypothetical protein [Fibromonadaceae bacterium]
MGVQKVLGVEIGQNELKVALVEPKRSKIIKIDTIPTSGNSMLDPTIYASVVSSWISSKVLPKVELVAVAFPANNCILRSIVIPKEAEDAESYVDWEFASAINSSLSNYKLDTFFFPNQKKAERAVVSGLRRDIVDSFCSEELEKSGFMPSNLMVDTFALFNLLECSEGLRGMKCVLKADEKFVSAFWADEKGPLALRVLPADCISKKAILNILESGFSEFPKMKRVVKLCGELTANAEFTAELIASAKNLRETLEISPWSTISKFSLEKGEEFSKLPQCLGAVGVTLSCV